MVAASFWWIESRGGAESALGRLEFSIFLVAKPACLGDLLQPYLSYSSDLSLETEVVQNKLFYVHTVFVSP
jgi:hypothetical protein